MRTWGLLLLLWVAPALVLLVALLWANARKTARRRAEGEDKLAAAAKAGNQTPA